MCQISLDIEKCAVCGDCVDTCPPRGWSWPNQTAGKWQRLWMPTSVSVASRAWLFARRRRSLSRKCDGFWQPGVIKTATAARAVAVFVSTNTQFRPTPGRLGETVGCGPPRASVSSPTGCSLLWYVTDTWSACVLTPWVGTPVVCLNHHAMHRPFSRNWEPIWQGAIDSPLSLLYHTLRLISRQNPREFAIVFPARFAVVCAGSCLYRRMRLCPLLKYGIICTMGQTGLLAGRPISSFSGEWRRRWWPRNADLGSTRSVAIRCQLAWAGGGNDRGYY